jgi:hypothetical protein
MFGRSAFAVGGPYKEQGPLPVRRESIVGLRAAVPGVERQCDRQLLSEWLPFRLMRERHLESCTGPDSSWVGLQATTSERVHRPRQDRTGACAAIIPTRCLRFPQPSQWRPINESIVRIRVSYDTDAPSICFDGLGNAPLCSVPRALRNFPTQPNTAAHVASTAISGCLCGSVGSGATPPASSR